MWSLSYRNVRRVLAGGDGHARRLREIQQVEAQIAAVSLERAALSDATQVRIMSVLLPPGSMVSACGRQACSNGTLLQLTSELVALMSDCPGGAGMTERCPPTVEGAARASASSVARICRTSRRWRRTQSCSSGSQPSGGRSRCCRLRRSGSGRPAPPPPWMPPLCHAPSVRASWCWL